MELRDLQLEELNILKEALKIIERHNLRYFMLGGTFLGAVRHKGFIPWDDDIDIGMPREDYEKFAEYAETELPVNMRLISFVNNPEYKKYFNKIENTSISFLREDTIEKKMTHLWIDIFPLDGMPNGLFRCFFHKVELLYLRLLLQYSNFNSGVNIRKKRPLHEKLLIKSGYVLSKFVKADTKEILKELDISLRKYSYDFSKYIVNFMGAYKFKEMFPRSLYDDASEYEFENLKLLAPSNYDAILSQMYGDYMTPPVQDQRFSHSIKIEEN